jgi:hypothetical protein
LHEIKLILKENKKKIKDEGSAIEKGKRKFFKSQNGLTVLRND